MDKASLLELINKDLREAGMDEVSEDKMEYAGDRIKNIHVYPNAYAMRMDRKLEVAKESNDISEYHELRKKLILEHFAKEINCGHIVKDDNGLHQCTDCYQKSGIRDVDNMLDSDL